jgi:hypothetical protein
MRTPALFILVPLVFPGLVAARPKPPMVLGLELNGHVPGGVGTVDRDTQSLALSDLGPFVHETAISAGVGFPELDLELALRLGWGFAFGSLPKGSVVGGADTVGYSLSAVPIAMGGRMLLGPAPWPFRFLLGGELGGQVVRMKYWSWRFGGRLYGGVHADVWQNLGVRLYAEGRFSQKLGMSVGPDVRLGLFGFGLAVVMALEPKPSRAQPEPTVAGEAARGQTDGAPAPATNATDAPDAAASVSIELASATIRQADKAKARRDYVAAERLYREGVRQLPQDPETRRNLEVPVRVDWAKTLIEVGRSDDAMDVLREALQINPEDPAARALIGELGDRRESAPEQP